jgi:hypothetical protein
VEVRDERAQRFRFAEGLHGGALFLAQGSEAFAHRDRRLNILDALLCEMAPPGRGRAILDLLDVHDQLAAAEVYRRLAASLNRRSASSDM